MATPLRNTDKRTADCEVAPANRRLTQVDALQGSCGRAGHPNRIAEVSVFARLRVAAGLIAGLHRSDFQTAARFAKLNFTGAGFVARWVRFTRWALRQSLFEIPEAMQCLSISGRVSNTPTWLTDKGPLANHPWKANAGTALPSEADTVVIGAGFTGGALAYHWSRRAANDRRMLILEMNDPASGSSGRNEGLVVMGRYFMMVRDSVLEHLDTVRQDLPRAKRGRLAEQFADKYCGAAYRNAALIEETIRREQFECEYSKSGWVQVRDAAQQQELSESVRAAVESGYSDWTALAPTEAYHCSGVRVDQHVGYSVGAASWHPAKWVWCLLQRAIESDYVELFTRTKVISAHWDKDHYRIDTDRGSIRAHHVVYATESYTPKLDSRLSGVILPVQEQAACGEGGPDAMPLRNTVSGAWFFAGRHGSKVVFGSGGPPVADQQAGQNRPSRFLTKYVAGELLRRFGPYKLRLTHEWSGTTAYTHDGYPIVGLLDERGKYIIAGMSGSGSGVSFNAGRCIVNRILGRSDEPDDYPPAYFAPSRLQSPSEHAWPEIQTDGGRSDGYHDTTIRAPNWKEATGRGATLNP